jgi:peptide/nickel transport system ATP-binding protein
MVWLVSSPTTSRRIVMAELVEVRGLSRWFRLAGGRQLHALRDVDLAIGSGATLGLVGESGCGKSTLGRCLLRLLKPSEGRVLFDGVDITTWSARELRPLRRRMQIIFQDPTSSLNPRLSVRRTLSEPLRVHDLTGHDTMATRVGALLERVGLSPEVLECFPHELSGGQRQRLAIARALSVEPDFMVADEPVSALDVSVQAQVLNLLLDLKESLHLSFLLISHDLHVVRALSDRIAVMYLGRIVEEAPAARLYEHPSHPYTERLLAARAALNGVHDEPPSPLEAPSGCPYHPRCPIAEERCAGARPELRPLGESRRVACHLAG